MGSFQRSQQTQTTAPRCRYSAKPKRLVYPSTARVTQPAQAFARETQEIEAALLFSRRLQAMTVVDGSGDRLKETWFPACSAPLTFPKNAVPESGTSYLFQTLYQPYELRLQDAAGRFCKCAARSSTGVPLRSLFLRTSNQLPVPGQCRKIAPILCRAAVQVFPRWNHRPPAPCEYCAVAKCRSDPFAVVLGLLPRRASRRRERSPGVSRAGRDVHFRGGRNHIRFLLRSQSGLACHERPWRSVLRSDHFRRCLRHRTG